MNSAEVIVSRLKVAIAYELFKNSPDGGRFSFEEIRKFFPGIPVKFLLAALPKYAGNNEIIQKSETYISGGPRDIWYLSSEDWMAIFDEVAKPDSRFADYVANGTRWIMGSPAEAD
jgi:hypothetical protein